jgi:two-component system, OmpR family, response regulator QseB
MHLLLIEDDLDLGASLQQALRGAGFTSEWLRTAAQARLFAAQRLLRQWRQEGLHTPLIIVTASNTLGDRLTGLDEGADDFLVKPFAVEELVSRVRAVTRRAAQQAARLWQVGDLQLDVTQRQCLVGGQTVALSPREFDILAALARTPGSVMAKHRLAQALDPLGEPVDFNAIEVHVHNLRRKVGTARVKTVRGVGYLLAATVATSSA